jgi:tetratricopeptide (TPR) repeat protein
MLRDGGHAAEAQESLQQALVIQQRLVRDRPDVTEYQSELAQSYTDVGSLLVEMGRPTEAPEWYRRALEIWERLARDHPENPGYQAGLSLALRLMAESDLGRRRWLEAREGLEPAIEHQRAALAATPPNPFSQRSLTAYLLNLTMVYHALDQPAEAIRTTRELVALKNQAQYPPSPKLSTFARLPGSLTDRPAETRRLASASPGGHSRSSTMPADDVPTPPLCSSRGSS